LATSWNFGSLRGFIRDGFIENLHLHLYQLVPQRSRNAASNSSSNCLFKVAASGEEPSNALHSPDELDRRLAGARPAALPVPPHVSAETDRCMLIQKYNRAPLSTEPISLVKRLFGTHATLDSFILKCKTPCHS
jgi:hypothetical protein